MRIIKSGKLPIYKGSCMRCGCQFICDITEVEPKTWPEGAVKVFCPECKDLTEVTPYQGSINE